MTPDAFTDLLDRCGADPAGWPPGAAAAVERLLAGSPSAWTALAEQAALDRALHDTAVADAPVGLAARALSVRQARPGVPAASLRWGAAAAAALLLGVTAGEAHGGFEDPGSTLAAALAIPGDAADAG